MSRSNSDAFQLRPSPRNGLRLDDRYRLLGLIDSGGTSDVYLADDELRGEPVIVKWLSSAAAQDPQHRWRFVNGARATIGLEHPAIARVHAVEEPETSPPYLVMEALEGESLANYLQRETAMPQALTIQLALQVASGLAAAHAVGIVHRDIKPGNLYLLGPKGMPERVKIIDFGLAKDLRNEEKGPSSRNIVLGTAQYMAPEQVLADPVDYRTDIYGFGAVLFRMLTGQLPFDLDAGPDLFSHQLFSKVPPPSWLVDHVDPRLDEVVLRCVRKHPDNRYPSMPALVADLRLLANAAGANKPISEVPLVREPDIYRPRNPKARGIAELLAQYFGTEAPAPLTSRFERISEAGFETLGLEDSLEPGGISSVPDVISESVVSPRR
jgi:eukaryotic-like serine/threonine-protein kinase